MEPWDQLRTAVADALPILRARTDAQAATPRAPGKWSPKEVIGHLIDSATNNHSRFVRAQLQDSMHFEGYEQDGWVRAQRYAEADWPDVVDLWERMNLHLAWVMECCEQGERLRIRTDHNLHLRAFQPIAEGAPASLDWFMRDYVLHLEHHLKQIGASPSLLPTDR